MFEVFCVIVAEEAPVRAGKLGAGQGAVVNELVVDDEILRSQQRCDGRDVGEVSADEDERGIDAVEVRELCLEFAVDRPLSRDEAAGRSRYPVTFDRLLARRQHFRMTVQSEIVVGREIYQLPFRPRPSWRLARRHGSRKNGLSMPSWSPAAAVAMICLYSGRSAKAGCRLGPQSERSGAGRAFLGVAGRA